MQKRKKQEPEVMKEPIETTIQKTFHADEQPSQAAKAFSTNKEEPEAAPQELNLPQSKEDNKPKKGFITPKGKIKTHLILKR